MTGRGDTHGTMFVSTELDKVNPDMCQAGQGHQRVLIPWSLGQALWFLCSTLILVARPKQGAGVSTKVVPETSRTPVHNGILVYDLVLSSYRMCI